MTAIWIILTESFTVRTVATGFIISIGCVFFCNRFLPSPKTESINLFRLVLYIVYLFKQLYRAGLACIVIILTNAHVEIVEIKTQITNKFLRIILVNSITLVPGSISLDLNDDTITVLWLKKKTAETTEKEDAGEILKGKLERMLIKAQK